VDEARAVLRRLERIESLDRDRAPAPMLVAELRALVVEAEAWLSVEPGPTAGAEGAVERLRNAVEAPLEAVQEESRTLLA
jgi:hypothetical protein